ncbi:hypothetical protein LUZ60_006001 [Juncus effusus]|nr:hypothetical protein LUZ60_006001 [Juncus effusus]
MASKVEFELEVKSNAEKFWKAMKDYADLIPKGFPQQYKSIDIIEGDGKSVGSVRLVKYAEGIPTMTFAKEKIEALDEENKLVSYSVIDGEVMNIYKSFKKTVKISPKGEGSLIKFTLEYEKANEGAGVPEHMKETATKFFNDIDAFLM